MGFDKKTKQKWVYYLTKILILAIGFCSLAQQFTPTRPGYKKIKNNKNTTWNAMLTFFTELNISRVKLSCQLTDERDNLLWISQQIYLPQRRK